MRLSKCAKMMPAIPPRSAKQETFGEQLANDSGAGRSDREAHANFSFAHGGPS